MRYIFGRITDRTRSYWPMTILGYVLDIIAVPALALVGEHGWIAACMLLVIQRMGKAIKKPAKDTIMSFAASQEGAGRSFGLQELLDQIGAFLGPVLLWLVMLGQADASPSPHLFPVFCGAGNPRRHHPPAPALYPQPLPQPGTVRA